MSNLQKQIQYWKDSSRRDWKTAEALFFKAKRYDACLFFCHLSLEKILKWLVVIKIKKSAPYTHDLAKLANLAGLKLTKDQLDNLKIINSFNISGRYDDAKLM